MLRTPAIASGAIAARNPTGVRRIKSTALRLITSSGVAHLFRPLTRSAGVVFMLHRFSSSGEGEGPGDLESMRALLGYLRRERHQLVDLRTLFSSLNGDGPPLRHAIAFTIDDGYMEHATVACPLFAEFDCPVTTFVTTGFLDGSLWFWWDQIQYVVTRTIRRNIVIEGEGISVAYQLGDGDAAARRAIWDDFIARCKVLTASERAAAIRRLACVAEVSLPDRAPPEHAPMTWDQLRACERNGMTFGPHTVTHPFLARIDGATARREIVESWERLRAEARAPVPIFAYPNGQPSDFGEREFRVLEENGLVGAVTAYPGFATRDRYQAANGAFLVPRFAFPDSLPDLIQQVDGLERFKSLLRGHG